YGLASDPPQIKEHLSSTYKKEQPVIQNNEMLLSIDQDHDPKDTKPQHMKEEHLRITAEEVVLKQETDASLSPPSSEVYREVQTLNPDKTTKQSVTKLPLLNPVMSEPNSDPLLLLSTSCREDKVIGQRKTRRGGSRSTKQDKNITQPRQRAGKRHAKDVQKPSKLIRNCNSDRGEKSLKCDTCGKRFKFKSTLHIHIRIHTGEKPYVCKTCGKSFTQQGHLSSHILIHTGEKPYVCLTCKKGFLRKKSLRDHMTIHTGEKPYVCKTCGKYFTQQGHLSSHILIHTGEKPYVCLTCKKGFLRKKSLRDHMIIHTGLQPHVCVTCEKGFILKDLTAHIRTHNAEKPHDKVIGQRKTRRGASRSTKQDKNITQPRQRAGKRHAKDVQKPSKLKRNCNSDRGEKSLKCDTCGKRFKFKSTLHIHILIHTGEKPYVCKTCGKSFTQQGHLSSHILIHTGEKPYVCLTCKKGFLRKKSLRDHMIIHTGLQPHVCVTCEKGFILKKDFTAHIRTHNAEKSHMRVHNTNYMQSQLHVFWGMSLPCLNIYRL
uniref:C2H2-type domain-containing protein n=1 Tax=Takifugu rubripes TaxID=31033 RepID=A0A674NTH0_TAKRU